MGCVIDGCPPGTVLDNDERAGRARRRRKPGQSKLTTARDEDDAGRGPLGPRSRERAHARHAHLHARAQQGRTFVGLRRVAPHLSSEPRRFHVRRQVRRARLARGRTSLGARNRGARGGGRGGRAALTGQVSRPPHHARGSSACTTSTRARTSIRRGHARLGRSAPHALPSSRSARAHGGGDSRRQKARRQLGRLRARLRVDGVLRGSASRCSTSSTRCWPRPS